MNYKCILLLIAGDKCTHVPVGIEKVAAKGGAEVVRTQLQGSSVSYGSKLSDIDLERRNSDFQ